MAGSFAKDQEAFNRSQGWRNLDDKDKARNQHIYDQIITSAGDDKSLTHDEYKNIFKDRGPWDKYAYSRDSIAAALAEAGTSGGVSLDANARYMRDNDLAFDGDDLLLRASGGWDNFDDDLRSSGKASYERKEEDGYDDYWNIYRYKGVPAVVEEIKEEEEEEEVISDPDCPDGQIRGTSGACIEDKKYAENPWEEPSKVSEELAERKTDWEQYWNPSREVEDASELGSIPYLTPYMKSRSQYESKLGDGAFSSFLRANQYKEDNKNSSDKPVKARDIAYYQSN